MSDPAFDADSLMEQTLARQRLRARRVFANLEAERMRAVAEYDAHRENETMAKKSTRTPKSKEPKVNRADLVVFAFRLPKADRDLIHKAAGPAGASKFVLGAALAAANRAIEKGA